MNMLVFYFSQVFWAEWKYIYVYIDTVLISTVVSDKFLNIVPQITYLYTVTVSFVKIE